MTGKQNLVWYHFFLVAFWLTFFSLSCSGQNMTSQARNMTIQDRQRKELRDYSRNWAQWYRKQKKYADSLAQEKNMSSSFLNPDGSSVLLRRFDHQHPVWFHTHNLDAAITSSTNVLWDNSGEDLSGEGITTGLWDGGGVLTEHIEFVQTGESRIIQRDQPDVCYDHSTHLAGTMVAGGVDEACHGMAHLATVVAYDYNYDLAEMASEAADGLLASNHSYGTICGWKFNSSDESWYWYGDLNISVEEDLNFGRYTKESYDLDQLAYLAPWYVIVKSAGNDRNDAPAPNTPHFDFSDHWYMATDYHPPDGSPEGFECLGAMSVAKNIITVGSIRELLKPYSGPEDVEMSDFSSWGPTDDGRIKPDLVANGTSVFSSIAKDVDQYYSYNGTSMAAASVTGIVTLMNQMQQKCQPGVALAASSVKCLLIHSSREAGQYPGPDYSFGWGLVNGAGAIALLRNNFSSGGEVLLEEELEEGADYNHPIHISEGCQEFKVTLCWTDPAGEIAGYLLDDSTPVLVNDLDIEIQRIEDGTVFLPWVLNPDAPSAPPETGVNHLDNVEQILLEYPEPGDYVIRISTSRPLKNGKQAFSIVLSGQDLYSGLYPPSNLESTPNDQEVFLKWNAPSDGVPLRYNVFRDDSFLTSCNDTFFMDNHVQNLIEYAYYVTAEYDDEKSESLPTNLVFATPMAPLLLPYFEGFEDGPSNWFLKNATNGWIWGRSSTLSSYYLDFGGNSGSFLAADSYSAGEGIHVWDLAITPPLALEIYCEVTLSFNYLLVTGIYGAIDELIIMACEGENGCVEVARMPASSWWREYKINIPDELLRQNTRFVFYYEDHYRWGMGAGIDDIIVTGIPLATGFDPTKGEFKKPLMVIHSGDFWHAKILEEGAAGKKQLQIISLSGQVLWEKTWLDHKIPITEVALPNLTVGFYLLRFSTPNNSTSIKFGIY